MISTIYLPNKNKLFFSELTVSLYKDILKTSYGEVQDVDGFIQNISHVLSCITQKRPTYFTDDISVFDLVYLLLQIRTLSMGNEIRISATSKQKKDVTITLNLDKVTKDIKTFYANFCNKDITEGETFVRFNPPSVKKLLNQKEDEEEYLYFIEGFGINKNNNIQYIKVDNVEQTKLLVDKLSAKMLTKIKTTFGTYVEENIKQDFLKTYKVEQKMNFVPSIDHLIWYIKLIFNEPLDVLYNNIFYLAKLSNLPASYIEQCTPGEYIYFVKMLQSEIEQESSSGKNADPEHSLANLPDDLQDFN